MPRLWFRYPDSLWKRLTVDGVCRIDPPAEWPHKPCWIWQGGKNGDRTNRARVWRRGGYGYVRGPDGVVTRVHILTFRELRGPIEDGMLHRHRCDTRDCANPWHIDPGTAQQNTKDMIDRGRRRSETIDGTAAC